MGIKTVAKNVEMWIAKVANLSAFTPDSRSNGTTLGEYIDALATGGTVTTIKKLSGSSNEFSIEPSEDKTETKKYFGSTSSGAQNSETFSDINPDVDVKFKAENEIDFALDEYMLEEQGITNTAVSNYKSYNMGAVSEDDLVLFVRIGREVASTHYYKNFVLLNPVFKKPAGHGGNSDDLTLEVEYTLLGNKTKIWWDSYNDTTAETLTNFI